MNSPSTTPLKTTLLNLLRQPISFRSFNKIQALLLVSSISRDFLVAVKITELLASFHHPTFSFKALRQIHCQNHPIPFFFNTLISSYTKNKAPKSSFQIYKLMIRDGYLPDGYAFPIVLKSCMKFSGIGEARQVHGIAVKLSFSCGLYVQNALVHVYGVCGECIDARYLFDEMPVRDVVSWTGLISGHVKVGLFSQAVRLFTSMDVQPNTATLVSVLVACGRLGSLELGKRLHGLILKCELEIGLIAGNALIDMYVKCESLDEAKRVFNELSWRDIVSWTSIISGLAQCKRPKDAIEVFHAMQATGLKPDKVALSSVLSACASLGALDMGRWVHEYILHMGVERDVHVGTAMVDMYAKCGCLEMALRTFHEMPHKNVCSWNALIGGLAMHSHGKDALDYFDLMLQNGVIPNEVTFTAVLSACSHSGFVEEGRRHFDSMWKIFNLTPKIEHYGCMVDLLGRAGHVGEAHELIGAMPMKADIFIWGSMLSACKTHGQVELSRQILNQLLELEPHDSGVYVLLSNIFAANDRWGDVTMMRKLMREKGIKKEPGSSVIEVNGKAHEFLVGEIDHPLKEEVGMVLFILARQVELHVQ